MSSQSLAQHVSLIQPVDALIRIIRGQKVMLDSDLAELYGVRTGALNQAVRRNIERFPQDFMFQITVKEFHGLLPDCPPNIKREQGVGDLKSQTVTSNWGGTRKLPFAFTEHGIAMLSSVLRSPQAIQMNIMIIRAFMRLREITASHKDLAARIEQLEQSHERSDSVIEILVEDIEKLSREIQKMQSPPEVKKRPIGFCIPYD